MQDAAKLNSLHEAALLSLLHTRFANDDIYTYTGDVLISVNPYKNIPLLYTMPHDNSDTINRRSGHAPLACRAEGAELELFPPPHHTTASPREWHVRSMSRGEAQPGFCRSTADEQSSTCPALGTCRHREWRRKLWLVISKHVGGGRE